MSEDHAELVALLRSIGRPEGLRAAAAIEGLAREVGSLKAAAEDRFRRAIRAFEDAVLAEVGRRRAEAARGPREGAPPGSPPVVEADLHAAGETVGPAFLVRFDSWEGMGRSIRGAPVAARWPWDRQLAGRDEGAVGPGEDET